MSPTPVGDGTLCRKGLCGGGASARVEGRDKITPVDREEMCKVSP
jgi:hypothetical protein